MEKIISAEAFEDFLNGIEENCSKIILRQNLGQATSGLLHPRTEANNDCKGNGIPGRFKIGRKTAYSTKAVVEYLRDKFYESN